MSFARSIAAMWLAWIVGALIFRILMRFARRLRGLIRLFIWLLRSEAILRDLSRTISWALIMFLRRLFARVSSALFLPVVDR